MGSSMGGLISYYAMQQYPEVRGGDWGGGGGRVEGREGGGGGGVVRGGGYIERD